MIINLINCNYVIGFCQLVVQPKGGHLVGNLVIQPVV